MRTWNRRQPLITRFCQTFIWKYRVTRVDIDCMRSDGEESWLWTTVSQEIAKLTTEQVGCIASAGLNQADATAQGRTSLYQVHTGTWLNKYANGPELLQAIATTAVIARLFDDYYMFPVDYDEIYE